MFGFFLCDGPVRNFDEAKTNNAELFGKLHREMLKRGIYLAPSPFEAGFTSLAHSEEEIDRTIEAFDQSFRVIKNLNFYLLFPLQQLLVAFLLQILVVQEQLVYYHPIYLRNNLKRT